jgi:3,4-dihydroxy 2-butanone 4-phosphate synthase/GTP cyclohydrolase II
MSTPIEKAIAALRAGRPIIVTDDVDRENEGDFILAAELATAESVGVMVRHSSGVICVALAASECLRLGLPPMVERNEDHKGTAYTISVDAREGTTTGISATERAHTIRLLASPDTQPADLTRPGHVFPLRAVDGGTAQRRGHTEAGVDLMLLAGLRPAAAICEIVDDRGELLRGEHLRAFAEREQIPMLTMDEVVEAATALERAAAPAVQRVVTTQLPTRHGTFLMTAYVGASGHEHVALHLGELTGPEVLVRLHSECLTGDAFGSQRCDCGPQLDTALARVSAEGRGVVVYIRGHEGRGIGLVDKLRAYALQDGGTDTVDANLALGLPVDAREWDEAASILRDMGVTSVRLMSNNPRKVNALVTRGIDVVREPHQVPVGEYAHRYLRTKAERLDHHLTLFTTGVHS